MCDETAKVRSGACFDTAFDTSRLELLSAEAALLMNAESQTRMRSFLPSTAFEDLASAAGSE